MIFNRESFCICIVEKEREIVIQINGKIKTRIMLPVGLKKSEIEKKALEVEKIVKIMDG